MNQHPFSLPLSSACWLLLTHFTFIWLFNFLIIHSLIQSFHQPASQSSSCSSELSIPNFLLDHVLKPLPDPFCCKLWIPSVLQGQPTATTKTKPAVDPSQFSHLIPHKSENYIINSLVTYWKLPTDFYIQLQWSVIAGLLSVLLLPPTTESF